jgi:hypothetical protein
LCHGGFEFLTMSVVKDLTANTLLFPVYSMSQIWYTIYFCLKWMTSFKSKDLINQRADLAYLTGIYLAYYTSGNYF